MSQRGWLVVRAAAAIALMLGFYGFALAIVAGLLWIPYAEYQYLGTGHLKVLLLCLGAAWTIVYAVFPRRDQFEPPGPELSEDAHPRLFALIHEVAAATDQSFPQHVYVLPDVNAFVTHRGGTMGLGSTRVMGIGLPLVEGLTVHELRAVLAHEFGHFHGGDVAIGPWIYKTRQAIGRAVEQLEEGVLHSLFNGYGRLFVRLTAAISRRQEFVADRVAARVAGAATMRSALRQVTALGPIHAAYMQNEVLPVLQSGFLPPLVRGFELFRAADGVTRASDTFIAQALSTWQTDAFDSHPTLRERLAALEDADARSPDIMGDLPASTLVDRPEQLARAFLEQAVGFENLQRLRPIEWDSVGLDVYHRQWMAMVDRYRRQLPTLTVDTLPADAEGFSRLGAGLVELREIEVTASEKTARAVRMIGTAIALQLVTRGWTVRALPGESVTLLKDGDTIDPFGFVAALCGGAIDRDDWLRRCDQLGLMGVNLTAPLAATDPTVSQPSSAVPAGPSPDRRVG